VSLFDGRRQARSLGDPPPLLLAHRWSERSSTGWQLRNEGILIAVEGGVEGAGGGRLVGGLGEPRDVGPAKSHRDANASINPISPQEGG
jgi:hypothetical protein